MVAAAYTVLQTDARSGDVVESLPMATAEYGETLNDAGSATVTIPLNAPQADPTSLIPGISGLVFLRDEEPVWGGTIYTANADLSAGTLALNATGFHSHYRGQALHDGYERTADQAELLRDWYAECNADNGINTDTDSLVNTGAVRSRTWTQYELKNVAEAVEELAEDAGGFNFRYVPYIRGDGSIGNRILTSPRGGGPLPFTLTHTANCNVTQVTYDSAVMATRAYAVGADNGNGTRLVGIADNADLATLMARRHRVTTYSDVKETETLIAKAQAMIDTGREPVAIPSLTLYPGLYDPTSFVPGDSGAVQADYGYVALLAEFVLTERRTTVDANGTEITSLALANKEVFVNGDSG